MRTIILPTIALLGLIAVAANSEYPMIRDTRKMRGFVCFINAQNRVDVKDGVDKAIASIDKEVHWDLRLTNVAESVTLAKAATIRKNIGATTAVFFVDSAELPALTSLPEERVAFVNVAPLLADNAEAKRMTRRIRSQAIRAFAFAFGAGFSQYDSALMSPSDSLSELDIIPTSAFLPYDTFAAIQKVADSRGLSPYVVTFYEIACVEGWAPAPKTEAEKSIWERVRNRKIDAKDPTARWKRDFEKK